MNLSNYHTHTTYCDGKDTPEEMVEAAIALGCPEIGFSEHCMTTLPPEILYGMSPAQSAAYREEIHALKEKYAGKIRILCGIEQDIDVGAPEKGYDYVIGSVHHLVQNGEYFSIDRSAKDQDIGVQKGFGGDYYAYVEAYYQCVAQVYEVTKCDVIGHFDLVSKFNEGNCRYDPSHPRVVRAAEEALEVLLETPAIFEVNTGAIARGYRTMPYPEDWMLQKIAKAGKPVILTSDCHDRRNLLCRMAEEKERLKRMGVEVLDTLGK